MADGPFHPGAGGVVFLGHRGVEHFGDSIDHIDVLNGHHNGIPKILIAFDVCRHADVVDHFGDPDLHIHRRVQCPDCGILHIDEQTVILTIAPEKDVDAFHPMNVGRIMIGNYEFLPCTPAGVMELIDSTGVDLNGANCVVVGRSNIVGKPMAMLLLHRNATVTICNSRTQNLPAICKEADVVVVAMGKMGAVGADCLREGLRASVRPFGKFFDLSLCLVVVPLSLLFQ